MNDRPYHIKAVLFYWEGTVIRQDQRSIETLKAAIGCPMQKTVLEFILSIPDVPDKNDTLAKLNAQEKIAALSPEPHPSAMEILDYLLAKDLRIGIISHSELNTIRRSLQAFETIAEKDFDFIFSRDDIAYQRPTTELIGLAAERLKVTIENMVVTSANPSEIENARKQGALTIFLNERLQSEPQTVKADFVIGDIRDISDTVRMGIPLPTGKLPNHFLREFLNQFVFEDPSVLINPGVGEDIAAVDIESEDVLVLKSDPITFATDSIGQYAVLINANDIATSGALPRWFLATLFFPCGTTPSQIKSAFEELKQYCRHWGITLCGGHTEITEAVVRPIVAGMMAGTVSRNDLIDKRRMERGDRVLFTKGVAIEGTAIIAREFGDRLAQMGISKNKIAHCRQFLDQISIITEAKIAAENPGTSAMHDVTEGGLATALAELSSAGGHKIKVNMNQIPVYPETQKICDLLDIDPLGLIGSGSLLICCRDADSEELMQRIDAAGVEITCIGEVSDKGQEIQACKGKKPVLWPSFEVDEITKLY
ncbi:MAG: HAD hydrolase-like protein [Deltaproteobacteria bacterium]|jgi:hydrogenase maturation factor/beta-phosphoglucomutase-like phosphatase (HAD superfamily)|nr:HAD hydrolase-like protein [Deltaproteobacteria bacterium]